MKYIIFALICISVLYACVNKEKMTKPDKQEIQNHTSINNIQKQIEKYDILFNHTLQQYLIVRGTIFLFLMDSCYCTLDLDPNIELHITYLGCSNKDSVKKAKQYFQISDSLFAIFKSNHLLKMLTLPYRKTIIDSTIIVFATTLYDSTQEELKVADSSFYEYEQYINKYSHYLYVLLYKYNDSVDSEVFNTIKKQHTLRKIKNNWYYYRSYAYNDYLNFENYFNRK